MKVVINKCFGGFGLSIKAQIEIAKIGCPHAKWEDENGYFKRSETEEEKKRHCHFCQIPREKGKIISDNHRSPYCDNTVRACPVLVKIVEKLGTKANGEHADLKVVTIPDGVDFEIGEYDGTEWVAEKHRTWG